MIGKLLCVSYLGCLMAVASCGNEPSIDSCAQGTVRNGDECVPNGAVICETGTSYNADSGKCDPNIVGCAGGTVLVDQECVPEAAAVASIQESAEPNQHSGAGAFEIPAIGSAVTLGGCITPLDFDGEPGLDADFDAFEVTVAEPTLLEVEVDGLGGLAGGFIVTTDHEALSADGWNRVGINLTGDTSRRLVFLPAPGTYAIEIGDSRAIFFDEPAGGQDTCYFATVSTRSIPVPTPMGEAVTGNLGSPSFFRFEAREADFLHNSLVAPSGAAQGAIVQMVNGDYAGQSLHESDDALGRGVETQLGGLAATDSVVFVIDPVINFSINEVGFDFSVARQSVTTLPSDDVLSLSPDALGQDALAYVDLAAGEVMHIALSSEDGEQLKAALIDGAGQTVASLCSLCRDFDGFVRVDRAGRYYLRLDNQESLPLNPFAVRIAQETELPASLPSFSADTILSENRNDFYLTTLRDLYWHGFTGSSQGFFGEMEVQAYDSAAAGLLDVGVNSFLDFSVSDAPFGYIGDFAGTDREVLLRVRDTGAAAGERRYNLGIEERAMVDLGDASATPLIESVQSVVAGEPSRFFVSTAANDRVTLRVWSDDGVDPIVRVLGVEEEILDSTDAGSLRVESLQRVTGRFLAFEVEGVDDTASLVSIRIDTETPISVSSSPLLAIEEGAPGVVDELTMTDCESITSVSINTVIQHSWRGDLSLGLTSPAGTTVTLRNASSADSTDDYIGNFPTDFPVADSLAAFHGENGAGTWTLRVEDTFSGDLGTLNSWSLNLFCL